MGLTLAIIVLAIIVFAQVRMTIVCLRAVYISHRVDKVLEEKGMLGLSDKLIR